MGGVVFLLFLSLVAHSDRLAAQSDQPFEIGELLRITAPAWDIEEQAARFLRLYRDSLTVHADSELVLGVDDVTQLDVSRGISYKSTLYGIGVGAVAGVLIGIAAASDEGSEMSSGTPSSNTSTPITNSGSGQSSVTVSGAVVAPIAGAFIGGFLGGLVGKAFRKHRWEEVPLERLRLSFVPRGDGLAVGVSLSY